jgi:uncharacterized protein
MIKRRIESLILESLANFPAVGLIGARQVGKTTLAQNIVRHLPRKGVYLDLERPSDAAKLREAELYLDSHSDELVILDEIQRKPELFPILRAIIDADRRDGRFLLLGSASPDLIRHSSESLAGRIIYHELSTFSIGEIKSTTENIRRLWYRGGFPRSFLADSDRESYRWREAFIQTHLERDIPTLGIKIPSTALWRFWQMIAHSHGQLWNASKIAASLGVTAPTVRHYLDILQDTFMIRQLHPLYMNIKKRLVKSPKIYLRDCGLLHALLRLERADDLLGHPSAGASWEGWIIEQILSIVPASWKPWFYRTAAGAEIDLVLERPRGMAPIAMEIKYTADPSPTRGFWSAMADIKGAVGYVVCASEEEYPLGRNVYTLPVRMLERYLLEMIE